MWCGKREAVRNEKQEGNTPVGRRAVLLSAAWQHNYSTAITGGTAGCGTAACTRHTSAAHTHVYHGSIGCAQTPMRGGKQG